MSNNRTGRFLRCIAGVIVGCIYVEAVRAEIKDAEPRGTGLRALGGRTCWFRDGPSLPSSR